MSDKSCVVSLRENKYKEQYSVKTLRIIFEDTISPVMQSMIPIINLWLYYSLKIIKIYGNKDRRQTNLLPKFINV